MEQQNKKRIKIFHKSNNTLQQILEEINGKLNNINTKIMILDSKINHIGNMTIDSFKKTHIIINKLNNIIEKNENTKITLLKEIGALQSAIIQQLVISKPISNNMLNAYS